MKTFAALLLIALLAIPFEAFAQAPDVAACAGCHGSKGEGNAAMGAPRIAAQPADYLVRQLEAYADGRRRNAVMEPIAKGLEPVARRLIASHYASLDAGSQPSAKAAASERARKLANLGDDALQVQGCVNCHGPDGIGQPPRNPYLAGQLSKYFQTAMAEWKSGVRNTDPASHMQLIAQRLGDADTRALAAYYASLPSPAPRLLEGRAPSVVGGAQPPATTGAAETAKGVGVEQGAPTTGGGQGPGGGGSTTGGPSQGNPATPPKR
jgi:cytochrome c553